MRIEQDVKLDFDDAILEPKRSTIESRADVDLSRTFHFRNGGVWTGIPIMSANMNSIYNDNLVACLRSHEMLSIAPKKIRNPHSIPSFGIEDVVYHENGWICLDVANGYMEKFVRRITRIRLEHESTIIIAGNVATPEMTEALILAGADIVKVGIGSGMACTTRMVAGVGYPQLSAVAECADAAHGLNGHIISDGGCRTPSDIVKAFAGGADFVALGGMLAGHDETGTEFYGESSAKANELHAGGLKTYRASEGLELKVELKGSLENTLQQIEGGLRSACAYVGARRLKDLPKCATFVRVNRIK